jgi:hypothetical protein
VKRPDGLGDFMKGLGAAFPSLLLLNHLKKNQVILLFWLLLFGIILWDWGKLYGVPYLFLDPEYLGRVNALSLFILGIGFGIFNTSFQITTYILDSARFRFLAGMQNAIVRFFINNAVLPLLFLVVFSWQFIRFQHIRGLENPYYSLLELLAFYLGFTLISLLTIAYFRFSRSRFILKFASWLDDHLQNIRIYRLSVKKRKDELRHSSAGKAAFFLDVNFRLSRVRETSESRLKEDEAVFGSSHLAAVLLEIFTILLLMTAGVFRSASWLQIPAGASIFILFGLVLMIIGAISYWLRGWSISIFIAVVLLVNFLFTSGFLKKQYHVFGISYDKQVPYHNPRIGAFANQFLVKRDSLLTIRILNRWKQHTGQEKPRIMMVCCSGGGVRAATWTMRVLQYADSSLGSELMCHTSLMTGASGGLIGAAYFRELCLRNFTGEKVDYYERKYVGNMAKDLLNPLVFSLVSRDLLFRLGQFSDGRYMYEADRGLAFEQSLHDNLGGLLSRPLAHYRNPEREALIPMMLVVPSILNDGRRLYISAQDISYMTHEQFPLPATPDVRPVRGVEWSRYFEGADAGRLRFSSALRMNATFPYIMPNISLPTDPEVTVMDGGLNDNFGVSDALKFASAFRDWIEKETSGLVLVCIRDTPRERPSRSSIRESWFSKLLNPVGSVYSNWARNQDYNNDLQAAYMGKSLKVPFEMLHFQYLEDNDLLENQEEGKTENRASLSWHLTAFEKSSIETSILRRPNQLALDRLRVLVKDSGHAGFPH